LIRHFSGAARAANTAFRSPAGHGAGRARIALVFGSGCAYAGRAMVEAPPAPSPSAVDISRLIDERPVGGFQIGLIAICAAVVLLDGYDAQIMAYIGPALSADLHIARPALGQVISLGLVGMMLGAIVFGPLADRFGRRPVLIACPVIFGVGSLLSATAGSVTALIAFRLLTGFGMGGAMPNTIALTAEYMPRRVRASAVMIMFCGFSIGAAVVGWVAAGVIPRFGWQGVFVVGGVLPCLVAAAVIAVLPESLRFLVRRRPGDPRAARYLAKIAPDLPVAPDMRGVRGAPAGPLEVAEPAAPGGSVIAQLFAGGRRGLTLLLWVMFFANLLDLYFINSWLPTIMHDVGIAQQRAILITTLLQVGGTIGAVVLGRILDRRLSFRLLALTYLGAAACVFLIGESGTSSAWLVVTVFAAGFGVIGAQNGANALAAEVYPTQIRSTGVGWAFGVGRVGSILGPTLGGMLVGTTPRLFLWAAVPLVIASAAALAAALHSPADPGHKERSA
jgi:AAHS family 4-hydroxybenzoate transporter-like MFS transporter